MFELNVQKTKTKMAIRFPFWLPKIRAEDETIEERCEGAEGAEKDEEAEEAKGSEDAEGAEE